MYVIDFFGGPGSGKSTSAAMMFAYLKNLAVKAELVHEAAKQLIYEGATVQLQNQFYVVARQWKNLQDLERAGCEIAISDSPMIMNLLYSQNLPYHKELKSLVEGLQANHKRTNILVKRTKPFTAFGRVQNSVEEAQVFDRYCEQLANDYNFQFDFTGGGDPRGQIDMCRFVASNLGIMLASQEGPFIAGKGI